MRKEILKTLVTSKACNGHNVSTSKVRQRLDLIIMMEPNNIVYLDA
jgi:hypothetical protein